MTKEIGSLLSTTTSSTTEITNKEEEKKSPSLFDALLKNAKTNADKLESPENTKTNVIKSESLENIKTLPAIEKINVEETETSEDIKKSIKPFLSEEKIIEKDEPNIKTKITNKNTSEEIKNSTITNNLKTEENKVVNSQPKNMSISLLDRLVMEAKNNAKSENDEVQKNNISETKIKDIGTDLENTNKSTRSSSILPKEVNIVEIEKVTKIEDSTSKNKSTPIKVINSEENTQSKKQNTEVKVPSIIENINIPKKERLEPEPNNKDILKKDEERSTFISSDLKIKNDLTNNISEKIDINILEKDESSLSEKENKIILSNNISKSDSSESSLDIETKVIKEKNVLLNEVNKNIVPENTILKNDSKQIDKKLITDDKIIKNTNFDNTNISVEETEQDIAQNLQKKNNLKTVEKINIQSVDINEENEKTVNAKVVNQKIEVSNSNISSLNTELTLKNKNETVAKELNLLNPVIKDTNINLSKEELINSKPSISNKSLMDKLLDDADILNKNSSKIEKDIGVSKTVSVNVDTTSTKDFLTNVYLSSQKTNINNQNIVNKSEAITSIKEASSLKTVEESASKLNLGLDTIKVDSIKTEITRDQIVELDDKSSLDKLFFNKNIIQKNIQQENMNLLSKSIDFQNKTISETIENELLETTINVNQTLALNMQTKIIGAKQQMSSMMSDVARKMYENYKPPVTAFRINLTPGALGAISVIMKNDRDNGLNISMNISNSTTLDSFIDNQSSLRSALLKTFDEETKFNLDFNQDNPSSSDNGKDEDKISVNETNTNAILESRGNNLELEEQNTDYM